MSGGTTQRNTSSGTTTGTTSGTTNSASSNTSTPNVPGFAQAPVQNYFDQALNFGLQLGQNPNMLATPANSLQQTAYNAAFNLPNGDRGLGLSNALAQQSGMATAPTYTAPTIDPVAQVGTTNANAAQLGAAQQAALVKAQAIKAAPAASLLTNFDKYANPVTNELVTQNLAAYDEGAARNTAQAQAAAARAGAFGGSRAGIAQAQLASDQASGRGLLSANLRNNAFQQQAALAEADTARRQQTSLFDAGNAQQTQFFNAGAANQNNQFNAGQANSFAQNQAGFNQQANLANAGYANQAQQANAAAANVRAQQQAALNAQGGLANLNSQQQQLDRGLSAAGLLANNAGLASNIANNNLNSQLAVGNNQYGIDRNNALAQLQGLQAYGGLLDPGLYSQFVGQTNTGTQTGTENSSQYGSMTGYETAKKKGGLLGQLGGLLGGVGALGGLGI